MKTAKAHDLFVEFRVTQEIERPVSGLSLTTPCSDQSETRIHKIVNV